MNVVTPASRDRHPFLTGKPKRLFIDGKWVEAASGKTFTTLNPASSEVLAEVAEGNAEDIDRAVAAARRAFNGPWSRAKPAERQALLLRLADLVEANIEELAAPDTLDMGAPISRTRAERPQARRPGRGALAVSARGLQAAQAVGISCRPSLTARS